MSPVAAIEALKKLPTGWDSYDAPPIAAEACALATRYLDTVTTVLGFRYANPIIGPTPQAGVALMWRAKGGEIDLLCSRTGAKYIRLSPEHVVLKSEPVFDPKHFAYQVLPQLEL